MLEFFVIISLLLIYVYLDNREANKKLQDIKDKNLKEIMEQESNFDRYIQELKKDKK